MDYYDVKRFALVLSIQAEIEGMKADNLINELKGYSPTYGFEEFSNKIMELQDLAYKHNDQL